MGLINDNQPVTGKIREFPLGSALRHDLGCPEAEFVGVVLPHGGEILWAKNQRFQHLVISHDPGNGGSHARFAEPNDIAHQHAAAFVEMPAGQLHRFFLKGQQEMPDVVRDPEFLDPFPRVLGEVPRHFEIDVVGRKQTVARPAFLNDGNEFPGDVEAA